MKNIVNFIIILLIFPFLLGCAGAAAVGPIITGYITWKNGEAHKYYEYSPEITYKSTKKALNYLKIPIEKVDEKEKEVYLVAGNKNRFKIKIVEVDPNISRLSIRINFMGDKPYAELIYKNVDDFLGEITFDKDGNPVKFLDDKATMRSFQDFTKLSNEN